jgi:septal ring factor EnvC (AmiA/AmiB activator)
VIRIQRWSTYGLLVVIDHGQHYSLYAQLNQAMVSVGDAVSKGQTVGAVGGANSQYGSYLHFEIREIRGTQGIALDPTAWLRAQSN